MLQLPEMIVFVATILFVVTYAVSIAVVIGKAE